MPEGPEIWRTADLLNGALQNKEVSDIYFEYEELKYLKKILIGCKVIKVEPRGKALLTVFDNDLVLYSHNQLYGTWFIRGQGEKPDTSRKMRVAIHNESYSAYLYSATDISILPQAEVPDHAYINKLGPDVLHPATKIEDIRERFHNDRFKNRKVTTLLLDQGFLSGIGNYLRSEILFYSGVYPFMKLTKYSEKQVSRLAKATLKLPRRSYETKGITNDPEIVEALKREGANRSEYRHFVYGRKNNFCHRCGSMIEEKTTAGRKVYFCPTCQIKSN